MNPFQKGKSCSSCILKTVRCTIPDGTFVCSVSVQCHGVNLISTLIFYIKVEFENFVQCRM